MKKLRSALIISFVIAFTIFIYEPIILYANNVSDLWFDLKSMFKPMIILFILLLTFMILVFKIVHKFSKKKKIYNLLLIVTFIVYFVSYIQGNYLIGSLPALDGSTINWNGFLGQNIITLCLWIFMIVTYIICLKKYNFEKVINISEKISLGIFVMLLISMLTTLLSTKNVFTKKDAVSITVKNYEKMSSDKNFIIFLVDAINSKDFEKIRENSKYGNCLDDFTYYPDTLSYYAFTRDTIPLILSGIPNHNEYDFNTYYNKAMNKSRLINELINKKYNINIYDQELAWTNGKIRNVENVRSGENNIIFIKFLIHELKYVGYKYLPYRLKKFAKIENMDFSTANSLNEVDSFNWSNIFNYKMMDVNIDKTKQKMFKFIHVEGAHVPFDQDSELNEITDGTYEQKIEASLNLLNNYVNWLKKYDVYNNSTIVVLADHGYNYDEVIGRQNPVLYIKGMDEHNNLQVSEKKISSLDLNESFVELLNGRKTNELFENIEDDRERKFIWYAYRKEDNMIEYVQTGNAWNNDTLKKTGKEYNR